MVERLCLKQAFGANNDGSRKPITAEKFVQYLEDSLRRKDAEMDKLQTKQKGYFGPEIKHLQPNPEYTLELETVFSPLILWTHARTDGLNGWR
eukprot:1963978-Rhodomonas_salina.2